jgi:hypothetical protein
MIGLCRLDNLEECVESVLDAGVPGDLIETGVWRGGAVILMRAVLRLDGDMYESTIVALESLYPKVSPGGFVIVDDYGAVAGCRAAVDDFRAGTGIAEPLVEIDWTGGVLAASRDPRAWSHPRREGRQRGGPGAERAQWLSTGVGR